MDDAPGGAPFDVTTRPSPDGARVLASGELDMAAAEQFVSTLRDVLADGGAVTLDAGDLTFLDSAGLRALDDVLREADRAGAAFFIAPDFRPAVRRTLELSGMLGVLPVLPEATASR
jgi:anti-anti-sigma factor